MYQSIFMAQTSYDERFALIDSFALPVCQSCRFACV